MDGEGGGAAAVHHHTRSPEDVFRDFRARRAGIVKALTTGQLASRISSRLLFVLLVCGCFSDAIAASVVHADVEKFYQQCDPGDAPDLVPPPLFFPSVCAARIFVLSFAFHYMPIRRSFVELDPVAV
jgi:hypothetical protein